MSYQILTLLLILLMTRMKFKMIFRSGFCLLFHVENSFEKLLSCGYYLDNFYLGIWTIFDTFSTYYKNSFLISN